VNLTKLQNAAEDDPAVWRCYDCGQTKGFIGVQDWETGIIDDVECVSCGSTNTHEDGDGEPRCDCGNYSWYCAKCEKCKCSECWEWFSATVEPDDSICEKCFGDGGAR
jgi:hypothetical protein